MNERYQIIYADPPWDYRGQRQHSTTEDTGGANEHYPTVSIDELCKMGEYVKSISDKDCLLFLWIGSPILKDAMALIEAWGFEYVTVAFVWNKMRPNPGFYTMSECELCFVAKKVGGKIPLPRGARNERQLISEPRREHSRKPEEARRRIERMFPTQTKIEMFARTRAAGWDVYGNEVDKFSEPEGLDQFMEPGWHVLLGYTFDEASDVISRNLPGYTIHDESGHVRIRKNGTVVAYVTLWSDTKRIRSVEVV